MRHKKATTFSFSLPTTEGRILKNIQKKMPNGWLSGWIRAEFRKQFLIPYLNKIDGQKFLKSLLWEKQIQRDIFNANMEKELKDIAITLSKLQQREELKGNNAALEEGQEELQL